MGVISKAGNCLTGPFHEQTNHADERQTTDLNEVLKGKGGGVHKGWNSHPPSGGLPT